MKISFAEPKIPTSGVVVFLIDADVRLAGIAKAVDRATKGALSRALNAASFSGKKGESLSVIAPQGREKLTVFLVGVGQANELSTLRAQEIGAQAYKVVSEAGASAATVIAEIIGANLRAGELAANLALGGRLRSYKYDKYLTKAGGRRGSGGPSRLQIMVKGTTGARQRYGSLGALADGVDMARDLVSEPSNIKSPKWMAAQCRKLANLGVKVEVLGEAQMRKLGMNALLAVGQGSARESQLVVMRWNGGGKDAKTVSFIGKGVTFDTGGISIKPAGGMEDMIWDMGGAGSVIGAMRAIAGRKAKANVIGVVGLVENMPDGNAQRPGDIVTSMSGQTIEVINTDAEGRLVLADALWYTQKRFKPDAMIDFATLTGAIMVALGREYAGLYANDERLAKNFVASSEEAGEKVWRMPLDGAYDRQINSPRADMKNVGPRWGGSITAAQFLQRYTNDIPWAHVDIAGVAWSDKEQPLMASGATGFAVRTLDQFVRNHYEK
ncbi:MAG: leucyl aminopeptidase [Alphaproteobacteria bacterium]|nr:leucyl aminopeptidase [Alphaproteobacteria bacterium]HCP00314.1 leucyl aminopeptidase [Rhodospirillaceae bacterium]